MIAGQSWFKGSGDRDPMSEWVSDPLEIWGLGVNDL